MALRIKAGGPTSVITPAEARKLGLKIPGAGKSEKKNIKEDRKEKEEKKKEEEVKKHEKKPVAGLKGKVGAEKKGKEEGAEEEK